MKFVFSPHLFVSVDSFPLYRLVLRTRETLSGCLFALLDVTYGVCVCVCLTGLSRHHRFFFPLVALGRLVTRRPPTSDTRFDFPLPLASFVSFYNISCQLPLFFLLLRSPRLFFLSSPRVHSDVCACVQRGPSAIKVELVTLIPSLCLCSLLCQQHFVASVFCNSLLSAFIF